MHLRVHRGKRSRTCDDRRLEAMLVESANCLRRLVPTLQLRTVAFAGILHLAVQSFRRSPYLGQALVLLRTLPEEFWLALLERRLDFEQM